MKSTSVCLSIPSILLLSGTALGQAPAALIVREAVGYISREVNAPITIDPRILEKGGGIPDPGNRTVHAAGDLATAISPGIAKLATLEEAVACLKASLPHCKTNGRSNIVMLGIPVMHGDSASVIAFIRSAKDLTAKDSADIRARHVQREAVMRAPGYRGPSFNTLDSAAAFRRMSSAMLTKVEISLVRVNGAWKAVSSKILAQS